MRSLDTNVLLRLICEDDVAQAEIARDIVKLPSLISHTVLLETGWVLASHFRYSRQSTADAFETLLAMPNIHIPDEAGVLWALGRFRDGADLADMLHIVASRSADHFVTFDRRIARDAGPESPVEIETA